MHQSSILRRGVVSIVALVLLAACEKTSPPPGGTATSPADGGVTPPPGEPPPGDPPPAGARKPAVPADHPLHGRFEGADFPNDCKADADCHTAGCSSEVCSADATVITTCDVPVVSLPAGTQCGCVEGQCQWWNAEGATLPPTDSPPASDCGGQPCAPPRECIEYYGIAGPSGPKFHSCEIRCTPGKGDGGCPEGTQCVTVADGPGSVCR
ncbi:MAG: hypothetical protein KDK70_08960 [Myxococcales bacterium]|nr:hypothetical protein [Myxococcales bacterium]